MAGPLRSGARIPLSQTASPPQLEDTIAHLADFIGSGSIQRIQNTIVGLNRVTPEPNELRRVSAQFAADITDLSDNIDNVDLLLNSAANTATVLSDYAGSIRYWFSHKGMLAFDRITVLLSGIGTVLPSLGSIYNGGFWLVPFLNSLANALGAMQKDKQDFEAEYPRWVHLFRDYFLPEDKLPAINITSIVGPDGRELSGNVQDVLRILGAMP